jgi:cell division protein FtsB
MALLVLALVTTVPYYIVKNRGRAEHDRVEAEVEHMQRDNETLRLENERQRRKLMAFRTNPRLIERRARDRLNLVRPDELILVFEPNSNRPSRAPSADSTPPE